MTRDLDVTRLRLGQIVAAANALADVLDDLHSIGYERGAGPLESVRRSEWSNVENVGDPTAQALFRSVFFVSRDLDIKIGMVRAAVLNYLTRGGPSPDPTRGSLISKREFDDRVGKQQLRRAQGDYVPVRHLPQPKYPGDEGRKKKR